jgi:hypothetical protein
MTDVAVLTLRGMAGGLYHVHIATAHGRTARKVLVLENTNH